jgi:polygalacturonase
MNEPAAFPARSDGPAFRAFTPGAPTPRNGGMRSRLLAACLLVAPAACLLAEPAAGAAYNVRSFGATGDGRTIDSPAINRAIEAAAAAGGGVVQVPAGNYLCFSIHLKSNLALQLDPGATIMAATPGPELGRYDEAEPNGWGDRQYQDFGHSHWHDSLIWGENLENVSITGSGRIFGQGLTRGAGGRRPNADSGAGHAVATTGEANPNGTAAAGDAAPRNRFRSEPGSGTKTLALKNCRNVTLRDFSVLQGGWFALLATGVDNVTIDNLRVDTNRDGFDIDGCRNVRIANCTVNAPNDDAIVLKSSYALGTARPCENITITGCQVSGFDVGTLLDGTYGRTQAQAPDRDGPTGRIKFGTESNGGFRNIAISNCVFVRSRGLALESVDGAIIEDVSITNLTMREVSNAPIFLRLGNRARGPEGTPVGAIRRVRISHVIASDCDARYPVLIAGLPGHPIEDVQLSDLRVTSRGGLSLEVVAQQPPDLVNTFFLRSTGAMGARDPFAPPEQEKAYPEPSMFGLLPSYGLFIRHASNVRVSDAEFRCAKPDGRPAIVLIDVAGASFASVHTEPAETARTFVLRDVRGFTSRFGSIRDTEIPHTENQEL